MWKPTRATGTAFIAGAATAIAVGLAVSVLTVDKVRPETDPNVIAEQFGVTISRVENLMCGDVSSAAGCFRTETPDVIYLDKRDGTSWERSVILHELGHVMQYRLGLPLDECKADEFALSLGATWTGSNC